MATIIRTPITKPMTDTKESKNNVGEPSQDYTNYMAILELPQTMWGGTRAIREKGELYLPKEEGESSPAYTKRLLRSVLLNAFGRTVQKLSGEVFNRGIIFSDGFPDEAQQALFNNIDSDESDEVEFNIRVFERGLVDGATHILVDYPYTGAFLDEKTKKPYYINEFGESRPLTRAIEKKNKWRPYWNHVTANQIIGFREEKINGRKQLSMVRIKENAIQPDGEYGTKIVDRIRVLTIGKFQVFELQKTNDANKANNESSDWVLIEEGNTFLDYIPLVTFMPGKKINRLMAEPPLEDLAWLNLLHYQSDSDQRNILHYVRLVLIFGKCLKDQEGEEPSKLLFGANRMIHSSDPDADLKMVEHSGQAIGAGRQDLRDLESQMSLFGLTFLMPKVGRTSATEKYIDYSENQSALKIWAEMYNNVLQTALEYTSNYLESPITGKMTVNTSFKTSLQDQDSRILAEGWSSGLIPRELVVEEFKRRGILVGDITMNDIRKMFNKDKDDGKEGIPIPSGNASGTSESKKQKPQLTMESSDG